MNIPEKLRKNLERLILVAGIMMPAIIVALFPKLFHASDVDDFWRWSQGWAAGWKNIYLNCDRCNYPLLGTFLSGGVMTLIGADTFEKVVAPFRYYLAIVDGLNVLIIYFILKQLKLDKAPVWAGIIGLLPTSWMGSSAWGQIDGIGQLLILGMFALFIWFNLQGKTGKARYFMFLAAAGLLIACMLLTKQLIIFSLISLGFMTLVNIYLYSRRPVEIISALAVLFAAFIIPILLIDSSINLLPSYFSHLQYVLLTGSKHGDTVSSFGFNIWIFLVEKPLGSSRIPIDMHLGSASLFSIVPYKAGVFLFLAVNLVLMIFFSFYFQRQYKANILFFDRENLLILLLHLALVNLSFNLFLTGTHERYLYHFYPFIIIACLGLFGRNQVYTLLAGAMLYGAVLYGYLTRFNIQFGQLPYKMLGVFHLTLYFYLIYLFFHFYRSRPFEEVKQP